MLFANRPPASVYYSPEPDPIDEAITALDPADPDPAPADPDPAPEPDPPPQPEPEEMVRRMSDMDKQNRELRAQLKQFKEGQPTDPRDVLKQAGITPDKAFDLMLEEMGGDDPEPSEPLHPEVKKLIETQGAKISEMERMLQQQSLFREVDKVAAIAAREDGDRWELVRASGDEAYQMAVRLGYEILKNEDRMPNRAEVLDQVEKHLLDSFKAQAKKFAKLTKLGLAPPPSPAPAPTADPTLSPKDSDTPKPKEDTEEALLAEALKALDK